MRFLSTRRLLQALLLVQAGAAAAIGYALHAGGLIAAPLLAFAAGVLVVLLVRLVITANNFMLAARAASATPAQFRLHRAGALRLFGEEFMATMLHSSWFMARARETVRVHAGSTHVPVLLLHGYGCNSGYWTQLTRCLDAQRISHATLDLEPLLAGIDEYVPLVERAAVRLCEQSGSARVIIVAHSMGGLVARAYLRAHGSARVAHVFTLGTPHHGTSLASFGPGRNAAQMRRAPAGADADVHPGSSWLRALAASESPATRALITSIYTHHDNIVAPQTSSHLPGAHNIEFGGVGHVAMGRNGRILSRLLQEIGNISTR